MADTLLCVGNLTIDEAISPVGPSVESFGGDALFAALAAKLAGGRPRILAPLGADAPPQMLSAVAAAGTDPDLLPRRARPTVHNIVRYDVGGGRAWELVHGDDHFDELSVRPGDVPADVLAETSAILLSAMALPAQLELAAWLRPRTAATIYFDPQEDYIAGNEAALRSAVARCDVFLPSEVEASQLAGTDDLAAAAASFLELGPHTVVIKRADAGCLVATRQRPEPLTVATQAVEAVDSTGAGDAFCGAFVAEHQRSADAIAAARVGADIARIAVSGNGISALIAALEVPR
ncbi:carbohydrate kinase family protein [Mycolicibacterium sp. 018/SC-01/001]|uniref:carbohydrate kinase family protein n=1 Tax=Mycolicibacterium sp. 018/SC-01/001 TaxID=2592069 RepID=UPI001180DCDA|nr:carbohydrate kinase family protein [Mycolicibacterium sp. 018/SC-01/001]TRW76963.1 carbohydrate kinase family protein [Mycolicibacterium sp. 018/SC-01/001]